MKTEIAIIGGGLSGLFLARLLDQAGRNYQLFEARKRLGGRIKTLQFGGSGFDLGPSWFWPGQPRMAALVRALGLDIFNQHAAGSISFEDEAGRVRRGMGFASMEGSWRLKGGMGSLIDGLASTLPGERVHTGMKAETISKDGVIHFAGEQTCQAQHVVLALPPRVAAGLHLEPALDRSQRRALEDIPTWMGGHAKFVAIYDKPFWREVGLSGDAMSHLGPLAEIHDASAPDGSPAALFGFLGVPAIHRKGAADAILEAALAQLSRFFGPEALSPVHKSYHDWAYDPETASSLDHSQHSHHPAYGTPEALGSLWDGRLHLCSTEMAPEMGGYMEGALAAAEMTAKFLVRERL